MLLNAVKSFLSILQDTFKPAQGPSGYGFYIDNQTGQFSFEVEPLVGELHIANSSDDLSYLQSEISEDGSEIIDIRDDTLYTRSNGSWTSTTINTSDYLKPGRMYYSPLTRKVFTVDIQQRIEQLLGR